MAANFEQERVSELMTIFRCLASTQHDPASNSNTGTSVNNSFDQLLLNNLKSVQNHFENDSNLTDLLKNLEISDDFGETASDVSKKTTLESTTKVDISMKLTITGLNTAKLRYAFVKFCMEALSRLRDALKQAKIEKKPGVMISVNDQKVVTTVVQFVVVLGICPNLHPGVGPPLTARSGFGHLLEENRIVCPKCLYETTMLLVSCLNEQQLSMLILSKHFMDILASLLQLGFCNTMYNKVIGETRSMACTHDKNAEINENVKNLESATSVKGCGHSGLLSKEEHDNCMKAVTDLTTKMYQPLVVRELLYLQGSMVHRELSGVAKVEAKTPRWLKNVCGCLLSKCLMRKNGVQNVLRGILEGTTGATIEWKMCEAIAQLLANCPQQVSSPEEYYKNISLQLLGLFTFGNGKLRQQYSGIVVQTIHAMTRRYPVLTGKYVMDPLMRPFLLATGEVESRKECEILANETDLSRSIEDIHKIIVGVPVVISEVLLDNLRRIVFPLFELFCFTRHGVSHIRTALLEILSTFFKGLNENDSLTLLFTLAFYEGPPTSLDCNNSTNQIFPMKSCFVFEYGSAGGVVLKAKPQSCVETDFETHFVDKILNKSDSGQTRALCLVELLQKNPRENVPGKFFLYLLEQVQQIVAEPNFEAQAKIKTMTIFNVLTLMCEKLGPSVLKNTGHMISFVKATLSRAHHVYTEKERDGIGESEFELETISLALGMLSALVSGAVEVGSADHVQLQDLCPLLREISESHVVGEIQELANDLLVVILTQNAVRAETSDNNSPGSQSSQCPPDIGFDEALKLLCDPLLPARGHALMRLATLLRAKDGKAVAKIDMLLKTFHDNLLHEDSYIYLAAIEGLVAAADVKTAEVLPYLVEEFAAFHTQETGTVTAQEGNVRRREERSAVTRMKVAEALLRAAKRCGEMTSHYFKLLVGAYLGGVKDKDSLIRASSLSNLGELCRLAPYMLNTVINEVFLCVTSVVKHDKANEVRQAAVLLLTMIVRALGDNLIKVLGGKVNNLYKLLKSIESNDLDEITRVHARVAMGELEKYMREQLFPKQTLVKQINILPS